MYVNLLDTFHYETMIFNANSIEIVIDCSDVVVQHSSEKDKDVAQNDPVTINVKIPLIFITELD